MDTGFPARFAFVVTKKHFPFAKDRNRIKRLMRESVRLYKPVFYDNLQQKGKQLSIMLSYQGKLPESFKDVDSIVKTLLHRLSELL